MRPEKTQARVGFKTFGEAVVGDIVLMGYGIKTEHEVVEVERQPRNMIKLTLSRLGAGKHEWVLRARKTATLAVLEI